MNTFAGANSGLLMSHCSSWGQVILLAASHWLLYWEETNPIPNRLYTGSADSSELSAQVFWWACRLLWSQVFYFNLIPILAPCFSVPCSIAHIYAWLLIYDLLLTVTPRSGPWHELWTSWFWLSDHSLFLALSYRTGLWLGHCLPTLAVTLSWLWALCSGFLTPTLTIRHNCL